MFEPKMARSNLSNSSHACDAATEPTSLKQIYFARSLGFIIVSGLFYVSAALALWFTGWNNYLVVCCLLVLGYDYFRINFLYGSRTSPFAVSWLFKDCNKWQYGLFNGRCYKARLIKQRSFTSNLLLILYLRHRHGGRYLIIPRDSISIHNYRFLAYHLNSVGRQSN